MRALLFSLALGGCASSTGVLPFGKDTYTLSTSVHLTRGGAGAAKTTALQEASAYCTSNGTEMVPVSAEPSVMGEYTNYDIVFRCLSSDDPDNARPNWQKTQDIVIENR
jgi:hypothetical protein